MSEQWGPRDKFVAICLFLAVTSAIILIGAAVILSSQASPGGLESLPIIWRIWAAVSLAAFGSGVAAIATDPKGRAKRTTRASWAEAARIALGYWLGILAGQLLTYLVFRKTEQTWLVAGSMPLAYLILLVAIRLMPARAKRS